MKQAKYVRQMNPDAFSLHRLQKCAPEDSTELSYKNTQNDPGILMTKGDITGVTVADDGSLAVIAENTLLGEKIKIEADLVVLADQSGPGHPG